MVRVHGGFREEQDARGVEVYNGDQIRQRGVVMSRFLGVDCKNGYRRPGRGCRLRGCVYVDLRRGVVWGM